MQLYGVQKSGVHNTIDAYVKSHNVYIHVFWDLINHSSHVSITESICNNEIIAIGHNAYHYNQSSRGDGTLIPVESTLSQHLLKLYTSNLESLSPEIS